MVKAIIWDMDGVLIDSEYLHSQAESETAKHFGIDISPEEVVKKYSGVHLKEEFKDLFKRLNLEVTYEEVRKIRDRILLKKIEEGIKNTPFLEEVLETLQKKYKLAIASNGERTIWHDYLNKNNLLKYFEVVIFGEDVLNPKPNPESFLKAAKSLRVDPKEAVVIEDSEIGFKAAKNAGMILIARKAEHNKNKNFAPADFVIDDLREIPKLLERINGYNHLL